ncbi:protocatechuate-dioxygenase beta subunit protein, putative [Rhizoctonia solani AG-3 Rhs1AP]|uniref:Protocatechuate-dioxygenase beta subunit protein, putative n=2 Tax=Rhizoctonia solani AG-3 TaxID=1086053 RepID=X8J4Y1_9AGAM|nr:protocatechuate-dioxygenase beta subunit protein, putative [Rhizoctonia solani AG-3 Rhs1AP]KEP50837.1 putative protocatechuate-dioxygenase beta subunit protein [Rhizoctonia solani 123E]
MLPKTLSVVTLGFAAVSAHSREAHSTQGELGRRQLEVNNRHLKARNCASQIAELNAKRKAKRALAKRNNEPTLSARRNQDGAATSITADSPTYTTIQNSTCVTTPEVSEGPYYINNEYLRQDISEGQEGVTLVLDIGVMDVTTCQPLDQALVEIWHCNVGVNDSK